MSDKYCKDNDVILLRTDVVNKVYISSVLRYRFASLYACQCVLNMRCGNDCLIECLSPDDTHSIP